MGHDFRTTSLADGASQGIQRTSSRRPHHQQYSGRRRYDDPKRKGSTDARVSVSRLGVLRGKGAGRFIGVCERDEEQSGGCGGVGEAVVGGEGGKKVSCIFRSAQLEGQRMVVLKGVNHFP